MRSLHVGRHWACSIPARSKRWRPTCEGCRLMRNRSAGPTATVPGKARPCGGPLARSAKLVRTRVSTRARMRRSAHAKTRAPGRRTRGTCRRPPARRRATRRTWAQSARRTPSAARQIDVEFHIKGVVHALQVGPQPIGHCYTDGTAVHGNGTSQGTITRPDSTTWIVDLPPGSIGRLYDVKDRYPHAVNKRLYYVSLRFILRAGR